MWGGEWTNEGCGGVEVMYIGAVQGSLARQLLLHVFCYGVEGARSVDDQPLASG